MIKTNCPKLVKNSIIPAIALLLLVPGIVNAATDSTINFQGKIVRNDTGHEGLIGGICGDKYFGEHTQYIQERNRIDAELDRRESIEKLLSYKDNFLALSSTYANLLKETHNIQNKINSSFIIYVFLFC